METFSLTCDNCGAPLKVDTSAKEATCTHCGSKVGIKPAKSEPEVVILDSPIKAKPPIRPRPAEPARGIYAEKPYDPKEQRSKEYEEQVRLVRHGANLLDAATGYRSCLNGIIAILILGCLLVCGLCGLPAILRFNSAGHNRQSAPENNRIGDNNDLDRDAPSAVPTSERE